MNKHITERMVSFLYAVEERGRWGLMFFPNHWHVKPTGERLVKEGLLNKHIMPHKKGQSYRIHAYTLTQDGFEYVWRCRQVGYACNYQLGT